VHSYLEKLRKQGLIQKDPYGVTFGALSVSGRDVYKEPFKPLLPGVKIVPFGDAEALANALDDTVAAVIVEPIQGEGG